MTDQSVSSASNTAKMEALLEQLRNKHLVQQSSDSWNEFAKQIRMSSLDVNKQFRDPIVIHESLEKLQSVMPANSLPQILQRINSACQKLGLKYSEQGNTVFISTDLFYIDIQCDITANNQTVRDVRVTHNGTQPASVSAMTHALRLANVSLFMDHVKGYMDMYNLESEQPLKTKFFIVQQSLETDIDKINKVQIQRYQSTKGLGGQIYKSTIGLVQPRTGGLPTKLTFFITPYDFFNEKTETLYPTSVESIQNLDLGFSAVIGIEQRATSHQLQTIPLVNVSRFSDNRTGTQFVPLTNINSVMLPAAFILKFKKPVALSHQLIRQIEKLAGACPFSDSLQMKPMLDAIVESSGVKVPPATNSFTVALPGQVQNYFINELKVSGEPMLGCLVTKLPFSHPAFILSVIGLLRQQLFLNTLIMSCVRSSSSGVVKTRALSVELSVVTYQLLTATFKHPYADSIATVDFDLTDLGSPKAVIHCSSGEICSNIHASKVVQRSFSIPITMRAILQQAGHQEENLPPATKKVKADHGEIMNTMFSVYSARGHYMPYGSVNTSSPSYSKTIETNNYKLCLRRFSGYKRSCFTNLNPPNSSAPYGGKAPPPALALTTIPTQASEKSKLNNTPMLSSLLDDKDNVNPFHDIKPSVFPVPFDQSQTTSQHQYTTSQHQFTTTLSDLLQSSDNSAAADKKPKAVRKKRRTSEGNSQPAASMSPAAATKKRKKSDNEDFSREMASRVKSEPADQPPLMMPSVSLNQSMKMKNDMSVIPPTYMQTGVSSLNLPSTGRLNSKESHLAQLLHDNKDDKKHIVKTFSDFFDSSQRPMKQENPLPEVKVSTMIIDSRVKKEEKKVIKPANEKKLKRSDSTEIKLKESRSCDQAPASPGKKTSSTKVSVKLSKSKLAQAKLDLSASTTPSLNIKPQEDRGSPKEKVKKQPSEKKKKTPKTPPVFIGGLDSTSRPSPLDNIKMGFYGASDLKSLPKIPKRKPGESQASPTSPTPPTAQQKSPGVPSEWQRTSPVPTRTLPAVKSEEAPSQSIVSRTKSFPPVDSSKRPALLPTPVISQPKGFQRKPEVVQRQSSTTSYAAQAAGLQTGRYSQVKNPSRVEPSPNSPDELNIMLDSTQPVYIPTQPVHNDPASPTPEVVTQVPKAIPLDPNKPYAGNVVSSYAATGTASKPMLVKQKAVSRLAFSPKSLSDARP